MKKLIILFVLLLITSFAFADTTPPVTTFSSFQVPNTTDQNITLTCTDNNTGCHYINYNINNEGWIIPYTLDNNKYSDLSEIGITSRNVFATLKTLILSKDANLSKIAYSIDSNVAYKALGGSPYVYVRLKYNYSDDTFDYSNTLASQELDYTVGTFTTDSNILKQLVSVELQAYGTTTANPKGHVKDWYIDFNYGKPITTTASFLYSGAGDHNIQYFSTDNADNNETTKTSNFTTYGNGRFYFKDENSGNNLTGVQVNFNGTDYDSGANNYLDFNFQTLGSTNTTYLFTITKTGYSTRYYQTDLNYFGDFNVTFALLPNTIDSDIPFKVYQTDETTIFSNTYIEIKDKDTNYTIGKLKTDITGNATFNLRADDSNYNAIINNGQYTYTPVALTILYPKNEETLNQITEKYRIDITQNLFVSYTDLNTSKIVYLLPNTALPFNIRIQDMNGNYFARTYAKQYPGNPQTDTLQPYLVSTSTGLTTTITTKDAYSNINIGGITIKIYKNISGLGRTLVEQLITDDKGQALSLLVLNNEYEFECYQDATLLKLFNVTSTSNTIFIYLTGQIDDEYLNLPSGFKVTYTPTSTGLKETIGNQTFTQTIFNYEGLTATCTSSIIQNGVTLSNQIVTCSDANKTITHSVAWTDINQGTVTSRVLITLSNGWTFIAKQDYIIGDSFGLNIGLYTLLSQGLRSDFECESTGVCFPLMVLGVILSIGLAIWGSVLLGGFSGQSTGLIFAIPIILFSYFTWIPLELVAGVIIIVGALIISERR